MTAQQLNHAASYEVWDSGNREKLVSRARELLPLFAKNAAQTEKGRRVVEENIQAMEDATLFRAMVPKRYGGYEGSIRTHLELTSAVAESCGSTAWVLALINVCIWFTGLFSQKAQDEVFGANPNARVAGVFTPTLELPASRWGACYVRQMVFFIG